MSRLNDIVNFYRDCYLHDLKGIRITNFISKQSTKRLSPDSNEFFHNAIGRFPVDTAWAQKVEKTLLLNHKEEALYAGTFFIKGNKSILGKVSTTYIPLYIHELILKELDEVYFIEINDSYLNPDFIELINSIDSGLNLNMDFAEQHLPEHPFGFDTLVKVKDFFSVNCPSWNLDEVSNYHDPNFNFSDHLSHLKNAETGAKVIFSSLIIGIFKKPQGSLGVINELASLSKKNANFSLLNQFFGLEEIVNAAILERQVLVPASLSRTQQSAIFKASASSISMVLGPPGTGKSFTISCLALDAICQNESVLIISKNTQATRVVSRMIETQFGIKGKLVKADNQVYKRGLASRLSKMIMWSKARKYDLKGLDQSINKLNAEIKELINQIEKEEEKEIKWGEFYYENSKSFFSLFQDKWIQYQKSNSTPVWKLNSLLIQKIEQKNRAVKKYVKVSLDKKLQDTLRTKRTSFMKLVNALREINYTSLGEQIHKIDFSLILKALPIWLTTTKQISRHLPLKPKLFDTIIVDEASQCDIASIIPVLYRAKKIIVVGDPQQLNHVSFLSDKKQSNLLAKNNLDFKLPDYRRESFIDWTNHLLGSQNQITILDDHYRSKPPIIRFSNDKFYNNQLKIVRSNPIKDKVAAITIFNVNGNRDKQGANHKEAIAILEEINVVIAKHKTINEAIAPSIGIASPFSAQVAYLKSYLSKSLSSEDIKKHKILIGTPFHFQGEERDIMMISFAIDPASHFGSINYLNKEDVFNVLITRARDRQMIFTSLEPKDLPESSLLKEYLLYKHNYPNTTNVSVDYDKFLSDVSMFLADQDFDKIYYSLDVSGVQVDLTVVVKEKYYCIDLIGFPGEIESQFTTNNIEMLNRMGVPVHFITYSSWVLDIESTKRDLLSFIQD